MICGERKEEWLASELPSEAPRRHGLPAQSRRKNFFFCCGICAIMRSWLLLLLEDRLILEAMTSVFFFFVLQYMQNVLFEGKQTVLEMLFQVGLLQAQKQKLLILYRILVGLTS